MPSNSNYRELLKSLNDVEAHYLVVGGYAVMKYTEPYLTKNLDLWIDPSLDNAKLIFGALARLGALLAGVTVEDLMNPEVIYQVGVDYNRVDGMAPFPGGLDFEDAWSRHEILDYDGIGAPVLSEADLIIPKRAAGRRRDRLAVGALLKAKSRKKRGPR